MYITQTGEMTMPVDCANFYIHNIQRNHLKTKQICSKTLELNKI